MYTVWCETWEENFQGDFITYIPSNLDPKKYYGFDCFNPGGGGKDFRNGILTYNTLDNITQYWTHFQFYFRTNQIAKKEFIHDGTYGDHCFYFDSRDHDVYFYLINHDDCVKVRDGKSTTNSTSL